MTSSPDAEPLDDLSAQRSLQRWTVIDPKDAPQAARLLAERFAKRGWVVDILHSVTLHQPVLYAGAVEGHHNIGDVRKPRWVADHWTLRAKWWAEDGRPAGRCMAIWDRDRPAEGAKAKSVAFDGAWSWDAWTTELDYYSSVGAFEEWAGIMAPKPPPKTKPKPKPTEEDTMIAELETGVWHG